MFHTLVASDLDGTLLLPPDPKKMPEALFPLIRRLRGRGVLFCAASGRSYASLRAMFAPVEDDIAYMAENGALLYHAGRCLATVTIPRPLCAELVAELAARPDCVPRVNTDRAVYFVAENAQAAARMHGKEYPDARIVPGFAQVEGEVTQITATSLGPIEPVAAAVLPRWEGRIRGAVTGEHWLDFTAAGKGQGLRALCGALGIPLQNTVAFGDSFNDVPMLELAGRAYLMEGACAELRRRFPRRCRSVVETLLALEPALSHPDAGAGRFFDPPPAEPGV